MFVYNYDLYDKGLKSLPNDIPKYVNSYFSCGHNKLTSIQGVPKCVGNDFYCCYNKLTSLQGAPKYVSGNFGCDHNKLTSLQYAPKYVGGDFWCHNNTKKFTEKEVRTVCDVKGRVYV